MDVKSKIVYLHPAIRTYRLGIFEVLYQKLKVSFFWSESADKYNKHICEEVNRIFKNTNIKYIQAKNFNKLPVDGFSFGLFKLPFMGYKIYIFSSIVSTPSILLIPILKILRKKVIVFDELWRYPKEIKKYKLIYPYISFLVNKCVDGVVTAGSKAKDFYINEFGFDKSKIEVAYNTTVDTKEYVKDDTINQIIKNKINAITSKKKLLYLGRIVKYKGLDILIRAMEDISEQYDLIIVGEGEFRGYCENLTKELRLNNRIHFLGSCFSNETPYYYKNSDIFVLPTKFKLDDNVQMESWGFTVNEAMALEMPVVTTTAVGSGFDLVQDGVTGGLAQAGNVKSVADKINFVINNNHNNCFGKRARKHLMRTCNYDDNFEVYVNMIKLVSKN